MTAFDNRGAGRTSMPDTPLTVEAMADDAAAVLRALDIPSAHVAGFSGASIIAQELAIRHPALVRPGSPRGRSCSPEDETRRPGPSWAARWRS